MIPPRMGQVVFCQPHPGQLIPNFPLPLQNRGLEPTFKAAFKVASQGSNEPPGYWADAIAQG